MLAVLYYAAPNAKLPGFTWISPGSVVAVVVWILASALFAFYVANFGSYNKTYGTLGGVVTFLVWLWITNLAVLFGARAQRRARAQPRARGGPARGGGDPAAAAHGAQGQGPGEDEMSPWIHG